MENIKTYFALALADVRSQMQHKASFVLGALGNFCATIIDFLGIWTLFASFGALDGWTLPEIAVLYGVINVSFTIAEAMGRGFDLFAGMVKAGDFDRVLLRPRGTLFQVLAGRLELTRLGRLTQGAGVLALGIALQPQGMNAGQLGLLALCIAGGVMLFLGLLMMQAAMCFWTVESLEAFNVLTYGGVTMASYPLSVYRGWFRRFFLFVVPLGCLNYLPAAVLFGKSLPYPSFTAYLAPLAGGLFLLAGALVWQLGVRHYRSAGA